MEIALGEMSAEGSPNPAGEATVKSFSEEFSSPAITVAFGLMV